MSQSPLSYYREELSFIRRMGAQFAADNPSVASRLGISEEAIKDPHVERLVEAVAFLTGRIRQKLDDGFPDVVNALMGVLYPHYAAPIPSMAITRFAFAPGQGADQVKGAVVPRGTPVETDAGPGAVCRFQTCYPVTLWPVRVQTATLGPLPPVSGRARHPERSASLLRIELQTLAPAVRFGDIAFHRLISQAGPLEDGAADRPAGLRFFLKTEIQHANQLYELLSRNVVQVRAATGPADPQPLVLGADVLRPEGFARDQNLLPYNPRAFMGYRLLTEYFAFPQKYHFFDVLGLWAPALQAFGNRLDVLVYLDRACPELEGHVTADTFALGCAPMINLYRQRAEPIRMTQTSAEYRVVPDPRQPRCHEVYSVDSVTGTSSTTGSQPVEYLPFYSYSYAPRQRAPAYWWASRRPGTRMDGEIEAGTEVFLLPVDLDFQAAPQADVVLHAQTTCLNRNLPAMLPFGGGKPELRVAGLGAIVASCLTKPTPTYRPQAGDAALWRLVGHLSLNHLSLVGGEDAAAALRQMLRLYNFTGSADADQKIAGLTHVSSRPAIGRVGGSLAGGLCRGLEVTCVFDEQSFADNGLFLFAGVIERFLGLYCAVNSFSQLVARTRQREKELHRWNPRAGEQVLL